MKTIKPIKMTNKEGKELIFKEDVLMLIDECSTHWDLDKCHNHIDKQELKQKIEGKEK